MDEHTPMSDMVVRGGEAESQTMAIDSALQEQEAKRRASDTEFALLVMGEKVRPMMEEKCVQRIAEYLHTIVVFQKSYSGCQQFMDGEVERRVEGVAGRELPESVQQKSLTEVGEMLHEKLMGNSRSFCNGFVALQNFLEKDGLFDLRALMEMHEIEIDGISDAPVPSEQVMVALKFKQIQQSALALQIPQQGETATLAEVFLHNINRQLGDGGRAAAWGKKIMECKAHSARLKEAVTEKQNQIAELNAIVVKNSDQLAELNAAMARGQGFREVTIATLNRDLEKAKSDKDAAVRDEKNYTFWMRGVGAFIWQNDVALAKEKILRCNDEIASLETRLSELNRSGLDADIQRTMQGDSASMKASVSKAREDAALIAKRIEDDEDQITIHARKIAIAEKRLAVIVKRHGKVSPEHLLNCLDAKQSLANCANRSNDVDDNFNHGWRADLDALVQLAARIIGSTSFKKQKKLFEILEKHVKNEHKLVFNLLKASKPILALTMPNGEQIRRPSIAADEVTVFDEDVCELDLLAEMVKDDLTAPDVPGILVQSMFELEQALKCPEEGTPSEAINRAMQVLAVAKEDVEARSDFISKCREALDVNGVEALRLLKEGRRQSCGEVSLYRVVEQELQTRSEAKDALEEALYGAEDLDQGFDNLCKVFGKYKKVKIDPNLKEEARSKIKALFEIRKRTPDTKRTQDTTDPENTATQGSPSKRPRVEPSPSCDLSNPAPQTQAGQVANGSAQVEAMPSCNSSNTAPQTQVEAAPQTQAGQVANGSAQVEVAPSCDRSNTAPQTQVEAAPSCDRSNTALASQMNIDELLASQTNIDELLAMDDD